MATSETEEQTIGAILDWLNSRLEKTSDTPGLDGQVLLACLLEKPRSWVLAHPEARLTSNQNSALDALVARVVGGEPLPYILGHWEFFDLKFEVTPDVLIPRPETELLVERAIAWLRESETRSRGLRVLDVGTGSGCIAISLAVNLPDLSITATDISPAALIVANRNAEKMHVSSCITFLEADLFPNLSIINSFSLIVANPPYIPTNTLYNTLVYGHEPSLAFDGGPDGLATIRRFLTKAPDWLIPGGLLLMEIEASEGSRVLSLASDTFPKARIHLHKDLAGHNRLLEVQA
jgi:release factor glutamine methyltransferase